MKNKAFRAMIVSWIVVFILGTVAGSVSMTRDEWIELSKECTRLCGQMVNIVPAMKMLDALSKADPTIMTEVK